jgi:hypothetical protein
MEKNPEVSRMNKIREFPEAFGAVMLCSSMRKTFSWKKGSKHLMFVTFRR